MGIGTPPPSGEQAMESILRCARNARDENRNGRIYVFAFGSHANAGSPLRPNFMRLKIELAKLISDRINVGATMASTPTMAEKFTICEQLKREVISVFDVLRYGFNCRRLRCM
jgi:hypothetical protein